jgi:uncharacterized protein (DUF1800 family)
MDRTSILSTRSAQRASRRGSLVYASALFALTFTACGGGGSSSSDPGPTLVPSADVPANEADASRFLTQATFGATDEDIDLVMHGGFSGWLDWQKAWSPSLERPTLEAEKAAGLDVYQNQRMEMWWLHAMTSHDQLRLRVAYALSQIFVISDQAGPLNSDVVGMGEYYDLLTKGALGNFRDLLENVTLSPQMGKYLSMLKNRKADPAHNIRPDENYAREVMQLFTIGLYRLNQDGSPMLDSGNASIPTYDQALVETYARLFTGWNYANATSWNWPEENYLPMTCWSQYHDTDPKTLIDGSVTPAGQSGDQDLTAALDSLFNHPNVGPFIGRQLIERLVTSNPTPGYVQRVAQVFADDGHGERGNLFAVVKAILLDDEARNGPALDPNAFGKLKEPILRQTELWRAFHARAASGMFKVWNPEDEFGQAPLRSSSVFNFYSPFYMPPGEMQDGGLYGPEFQITTHTLITATTNRLFALVFWQNSSSTGGDADTVRIQIQAERARASDPEALVDHLNLLLMGGQMSSAMRDVVVSLVNDTPLGDGSQRVLEATWMILASPEGAVQK